MPERRNTPSLPMSENSSAKASGVPRTPGIVERTALFADRIIKLCLALPGNSVGWELGRQLVRAGTSVGANVEESQAAESKADFVHKLKTARKECRESRYFIRRIAVAKLIPGKRLEAILDESDQVLRLLTSIILATERDSHGTFRKNGSPGRFEGRTARNL